MNAITVNTFPSLNAFTSARGWFLALIVLLHFAFFWALSNGLSIGAIVNLPQTTVIDFLPTPQPPERPLKQIDTPPIKDVYVPQTPAPAPRFDEEEAPPFQHITDIPPPAREERGGASPAPIEIGPEIDARIGLTPPLYPPSAIRGNQTGTVLLSVLVLENGRVGEVRIDQSSGHPSLDESAAREARRWKLKPGMRDGVPVAMWKQIPVTFRLKDGVKM
jgi:periplasmic protein TonB